MTTKQAPSSARHGAGLLLRLGQRLAVDDPHEAIESRAQAAVKIVLSNFGDELFLDQAFGDGIRHRAFQPISDLDAHRQVARGDHHDDAVVHALAADLPCLRHPDGERLDRLGIGRPADQFQPLAQL